MREVGKRYSNHPDFKTELVTPTLVKEYIPDTPTNSLFDTGVHYPTLRSRIVAEYQYGSKMQGNGTADGKQHRRVYAVPY